MGLIDSARLNALKARVEKECSRRNLTGSVALYAGDAYDYTVAPAEGVIVLEEHYEKLAVPLNAINNIMQPDTDGNRIISDSELDKMEEMLTTLEARDVNDKSATDCSASCTGLCYSCAGTCSGGCSGGCTGGCIGCGTICTYGCSTACSYSCEQNCVGLCKVDCGNAGCQGQCVLSCYAGCDGGCGGGCSMCSVNCSGVAQYD